MGNPIKTYLNTLDKRPIVWTGILERRFREFVSPSNLNLSEKELADLYGFPERMVNLVQAGIVASLALTAGKESLIIYLASESNAQDRQDFSRSIPYSDIQGKLEVRLLLTDIALANLLGVKELLPQPSKNLIFLLHDPPWSQAGRSRQ